MQIIGDELTREQIILERVECGELEIDSEGRIWRSKLRRGSGRRDGSYTVLECERRRAEQQQKNGYLRVVAVQDDRVSRALAHRIVWINANGPIPDGLTINHKNGVKDDNRIDNLELATQSDQIRHSIHVLGNRPVCGSKHHWSKLTEADALEMRHLERHLYHSEIADLYGVSRPTVSRICSRTKWKHV